jgi:hypothetical protein
MVNFATLDLYALKDVLYVLTLPCVYHAKNICDLPLSLDRERVLLSGRVLVLASCAFYHGYRLSARDPGEAEIYHEIRATLGFRPVGPTIRLEQLVAQALELIEPPPCVVAAALSGKLAIPKSVLDLGRSNGWRTDYDFFDACDCMQGTLETKPFATLNARDLPCTRFVIPPRLMASSIVGLACGYPSVERKPIGPRIPNDYVRFLEPTKILLSTDGREETFLRNTVRRRSTRILLGREFRFYRGSLPCVLFGPPSSPEDQQNLWTVLSQLYCSIEKIYVWGAGAIVVRKAASRCASKDIAAGVEHLEVATSAVGSMLFLTSEFTSVLSLLPSLQGGDSVLLKTRRYPSREPLTINCFREISLQHIDGEQQWICYASYNPFLGGKQRRNGRLGLLDPETCVTDGHAAGRLASIKTDAPGLTMAVEGNARTIERTRVVWSVGAASGVVLRAMAFSLAKRPFCSGIPSERGGTIVYAFPGSGKTTFQEKMKLKGIEYFDTDEILGAEDFGTKREVEALKELNMTHLGKKVLTNLCNADALGFLKDHGWYLIAVTIEDAEWERRFRSRSDLTSQDKPWSVWRKYSTSPDFLKIFDSTVHSFDELEKCSSPPASDDVKEDEDWPPRLGISCSELEEALRKRELPPGEKDERRVGIVAPSLMEKYEGPEDAILIFPRRPQNDPSLKGRIVVGKIGEDVNKADLDCIIAVEVLPSLEWEKEVNSVEEEYALKIADTLKLSTKRHVKLIATIPYGTEELLTGSTFKCIRVEVYEGQRALVYSDGHQGVRSENCISASSIPVMERILKNQGISSKIIVHHPCSDLNLIRRLAGTRKMRVDEVFLSETVRILQYRRLVEVDATID